MATIKIDVTDVESGGGGEQPQPGMYAGKIVSVTHRDKKANGDATNDLEVVVDVGQEYVRLWSYINLDSTAAKWKVREFLDAVGLPAKVELTPKKLKDIEGTKVNVKIAADKDLDGDYRGKIKNLFKPGSGGEEPASGDDDGEDFYAEWTDEDLKAELKEKDIKLSGRFSREKAIAALSESEPEPDEPEADAEPTGDVPEVPEELLPDLNSDPDFYAEWPDEDIKGYVVDLGDAITIEGRYGRQKAIDALVALAEAVEGGGSGGDSNDTPEADDLDEWSDQDLKDEIAARKEQGVEIDVTGRWTREKAIEALRADNANADPF